MNLQPHIPLVPKLQFGNPLPYKLLFALSWEAGASKTAFPSWSLGTGKTTMATANPIILAKLRVSLEALYGKRIERVVLFGSQARGDALPDSDYDMAFFLKDLEDRWKELDRLAELRVHFLDESGMFIDIKPYPVSAYWERTPLMHEIRREGINL